MQVDLRPVERAFAGADHVLDLMALERLFESVLGSVPLLIRPQTLLRARRELGASLESEEVVEEARVLDHAVDLVLDLVLGDEDVRVVLRDVLDAQEAVQRAAALVAIQSRRLGITERQLAVTPPPLPKEEHVPGTVHWLQRERLLALMGLHEEHVL